MSLDFDTPDCTESAAIEAQPTRPAADTLVLFVGAACRPAAPEFSTLGRDGVRCVWSADLDQALRMARLARFLGIEWDRVLTAPLPHSRTTLSAPDPEKWKRNADELEIAMPLVEEVAARARALFADG